MAEDIAGVVFVDTNSARRLIPLAGPVNGPVIVGLRTVLAGQGLRLALPALVRTEYLRQYREMASDLVAKLRNASKELRRLPDWEHGEPRLLPDVGQLTASRAAAFDKAFAFIFDCPPERALEALHREGDHRAPAEDGTGARDAGIWFTVLAYAEKHPNETIYFVTADGDFRLNGRLHPDLKAEAPGNVRLVKDEVALAKNFNGEAKSPLTADEIASSPVVRGAVEVAAYGLQVMWDLTRAQHITRGFPIERSHFAGSATTEYQLLAGAHVTAVHVGDDLWVTMRATWRLARPATTFPEGNLASQTFEVEFDIPMTLMISVAGKQVMEAHVLHQEQAQLRFTPQCMA